MTIYKNILIQKKKKKTQKNKTNKTCDIVYY